MTANIKKLLLNLRTVALDGRCPDGERSNARDLYEKLLFKHNLTDEDIKPAKVSLVWFRYKDRYERKLLEQMCAHVTKSVNINFAISPRLRRQIAFNLTEAQAADIKRRYSLLRVGLRKELNKYLSAFIQANYLGVPTKEESELSSLEEDEILAILKIAKNMKPTKIAEIRVSYKLIK